MRRAATECPPSCSRRKTAMTRYEIYLLSFAINLNPTRMFSLLWVSLSTVRFRTIHNSQVASVLLEVEVEVDSQEEDGWTALMFSAQNGHEQV